MDKKENFDEDGLDELDEDMEEDIKFHIQKEFKRSKRRRNQTNGFAGLRKFRNKYEN